ncbi:hypothetical protein [Nostoc sp.]
MWNIPFGVVVFNLFAFSSIRPASVAAIAEIAAYESGIVASGAAPIAVSTSAAIVGVGSSTGSFVGGGVAIVAAVL